MTGDISCCWLQAKSFSPILPWKLLSIRGDFPQTAPSDASRESRALCRKSSHTHTHPPHTTQTHTYKHTDQYTHKHTPQTTHQMPHIYTQTQTNIHTHTHHPTTIHVQAHLTTHTHTHTSGCNQASRSNFQFTSWQKIQGIEKPC